jgi:hypothetical protein
VRKLAGALVCVALVCAAASAEDEKAKFTATIDIDANLFRETITEYSSDIDRQYAHGTTATENLPFGNFDFLTDTSVGFTVDKNRYGGNLSLDDKDGIGGIKAWVKFGSLFKITTGNDIGAGYADYLDADPGMRIYTGSTPADWDASKDPDNITQDKGLLLEMFIKSFSLAFAGQYYDGNVLSLDVNSSAMEHSQWEDVDQKKYGYGARIGYELGQWGKVNVSYVNQYTNVGENNYRLDANRKPVPAFADTEKATHMFGLYASLTPPVPGLAVTLGYNGMYTQYLDEFYHGTSMVKTLVPSVFQNGINLNARYKGIEKLTLRTDHNYSFWTDRDYSPFAIPGKVNYGLESSVEGATLSNVEHWLLWNGLGAAYEFTRVFKLSLYIRNLYREDTAAQSGGTVWKVSWDKFVAELTSTFKMNDSVELYIGLNLENTIHFSAKEVNAQISNMFVSWASPSETTDSKLIFKIPVGITVNL